MVNSFGRLLVAVILYFCKRVAIFALAQLQCKLDVTHALRRITMLALLGYRESLRSVGIISLIAGKHSTHIN